LSGGGSIATEAHNKKEGLKKKRLNGCTFYGDRKGKGGRGSDCDTENSRNSEGGEWKGKSSRARRTAKKKGKTSTHIEGGVPRIIRKREPLRGGATRGTPEAFWSRGKKREKKTHETSPRTINDGRSADTWKEGTCKRGSRIKKARGGRKNERNCLNRKEGEKKSVILGRPWTVSIRVD